MEREEPSRLWLEVDAVDVGIGVEREAAGH